jgi:predicted transporter
MREIEISAEIYNQQAIISGRSDVAKHKASISEDCPVTIALNGTV